ncbi:MAG: DUF1501 domain-containing protein [Desulfobacterales bacterium]|nr:DUF1501 domain-containing protein [Desulfobacterales bacterium]
MKKQLSLTRRQFLKTSAAAAGGCALSAVHPFSLPLPAGARRKKALVFIMLDGGNDSFNMLVPVSGPHYREYRETRSNLALDRKTLLDLDGGEDRQGRRFGVHPAMPEVRRLFNRKKLAFIANTGPLVDPVDSRSFHSGRAGLPLGLFSHADQIRHWQTVQADRRVEHGWFGRLADRMQPEVTRQMIPMNISLAGANIIQRGRVASPYCITEKGSVGLVVNEADTPLNRSLVRSFENLLTRAYPDDPFKQTYLGLTRDAQARHRVFKAATDNISVPGSFSDSPLSRSLKQVAGTISGQADPEIPGQTFYLRYIGWDHHDELLKNHERMLGILSRALGDFQDALDAMGLADRVVTFIGSDFGRTLTSNGNGTDHGWGGNALIMGGPVQGGQVTGEYPSLALGESNPLDAGDGAVIPTLPIDLVYEKMARWFGAGERDIADILPNLSRFRRMPEPSGLGNLIAGA